MGPLHRAIPYLTTLTPSLTRPLPPPPYNLSCFCPWPGPRGAPGAAAEASQRLSQPHWPSQGTLGSQPAAQRPTDRGGELGTGALRKAPDPTRVCPRPRSLRCPSPRPPALAWMFWGLSLPCPGARAAAPSQRSLTLGDLPGPARRPSTASGLTQLWPHSWKAEELVFEPGSGWLYPPLASAPVRWDQPASHAQTLPESSASSPHRTRENGELVGVPRSLTHRERV